MIRGGQTPDKEWWKFKRHIITEGRGRRGRQRMRWLVASPTQWTWVWVNSGSWWWTGRPGVLWFTGSQRVGHGWMTELNWITELLYVMNGLSPGALSPSYNDIYSPDCCINIVLSTSGTTVGMTKPLPWNFYVITSGYVQQSILLTIRSRKTMTGMGLPFLQRNS